MRTTLAALVRENGEKKGGKHKQKEIQRKSGVLSELPIPLEMKLDGKRGKQIVSGHFFPSRSSTL